MGLTLPPPPPPPSPATNNGGFADASWQRWFSQLNSVVVAYLVTYVGGANVVSFNTRQGNIVLLFADVASALGYVPYSNTNPAGYITAAGVPVQSVAGRIGDVVLTKSDVGLSSVDNTADSAKPVSTAQANAIGLKVDTSTYNAGLAAKVDTSTYNAGIAAKLDTSTYNAGIVLKVDLSVYNPAMALKANTAGLKVVEGTNAKQGTALLVAGTVVVGNTSVTSSSRIFLTSQADGGVPGFLRSPTRVAGTSFTILSSSLTDASTVAYEIFEPV